ncbi:MAG: hypothetical protein RL220_1144 [Bacteroidota bacterium]
MIKDIFSQEVAQEVISRINKLQPDTPRQWGKMDVSQMLAHCNVTYGYTYEPEKFQRPNAFKRFILKAIVKPYVTGPKPYKAGVHTAPDFIIRDAREFQLEKEKLVANIEKTQKLGSAFFEGKENFSFGKMSADQWNTLFYKHLDHHLRQFGV